MRRRTFRAVFAGGVLAVAIVSALAISANNGGGGSDQSNLDGEPQSTFNRSDPGGPFLLTNHRGDTVTDAEFRGRYMLVFFGYTHCPDICPMTLSEVTSTLDLLGKDAAAIAPLFVTVDPLRDPPEVLAEYVGYFHPSIVGLSGTPDQIADMAEAYRATYEQVPIESTGDADDAIDYSVDHSAFVYLMGPAGEFRTAFAFGTTPEKMARGIRRELDAEVPTQ